MTASSAVKKRREEISRGPSHSRCRGDFSSAEELSLTKRLIIVTTKTLTFNVKKDNVLLIEKCNVKNIINNWLNIGSLNILKLTKYLLSERVKIGLFHNVSSVL